MKHHPLKYWPMFPDALLSLEGMQLGMRLGLIGDPKHIPAHTQSTEHNCIYTETSVCKHTEFLVFNYLFL